MTRRGRFVPVFSAVVAVLALASSAAAQSRVRVSADTTTATVGARVVLTVNVEHDAGSTVVWPDSLALSPFEVLGGRASPTVPSGDRVSSAFELTLTAFELGVLEIPSFELLVEGSDEVERLTTDPFAVEFVSVGVDEGGDIRDIRGPLSIAISTVRLLLWPLLVFVLGVLAYAAWLRRRSRMDARETAGPQLPPRPAHEIALEALDRLEARPLLDRGQVKDFYIELSDIVRRYVEGRFGVAALEMTTGEIARGLARAEVESAWTQRLRTLLDACDLVKFAKVRPERGEALARLEGARRAVRETVPPAPDGRDAESSDTDADVADPHAASLDTGVGPGRAGSESTRSETTG